MKKLDVLDYCYILIVVIYAISAKCSYDLYKKAMCDDVDVSNRSAKENTTESDHQ